MTKDKKLQILNSIAVEDTSNWEVEFDWREENKDWLANSAKTALRILRTLKSRNISQKEFAEMLGVSPQQVSKIVKGQENFTYQTINKIEKALSISLMEIITSDKPKEAIVKYITVKEIREVVEYVPIYVSTESTKPFNSRKQDLYFDFTMDDAYKNDCFAFGNNTGEA